MRKIVSPLSGITSPLGALMTSTALLNWILLSGIWNDGGVWKDTESWNDGV